MKKYDLDSVASPQQLSANARRSFPTEHHHGHGPDDHPNVSVRTIDYKGHRIVVETTYRITVDGAPVTGHVQVGNDGRVHYHAIPNQMFESAVDMVKRVIDLTPPEQTPTPPPSHDHHH